MRNEIVKLFKSNFFSIFLSQIVYKVAAFCSSIILARILTKSDYGLYSYCNNIIAVFLLLNGFGTSDAVLQMGCENDGKIRMQAAYSYYGFRIGIIANIIISLAICIYACIYPVEFEDAGIILIIMSIQPILMYINNFSLIQMRVYRKDKKYSLQNALSGVLIFAFSIVGAILADVVGIAYAQDIAYVVICGVGVILAYKFLRAFKERAVLQKKEKKSFILLCLSFMAIVLVSHLLTVMDIYVLGIMLKDTEIIANYKVAATIPTALAFIPSSIMVFAYPYFVRNRQNYSWVKRYSILLIGAGFLIYGLMALGGILLSGWILRIIYGNQYAVASDVFSVLLLSFVFNAAVNIPLSNIIISRRKVFVNVIVSLVMGLANIGLNVLMIMFFGMIGAAYATLCSTALGSTLYVVIFIVLMIKQKRNSEVDSVSVDNNSDIKNMVDVTVDIDNKDSVIEEENTTDPD